MSQEERYGTRDMTYSRWHRRRSTARFVGLENAQLLSMIDIDSSLWVEYEDNVKHPVAFVETAIDVGQNNKVATVTSHVAQLAGRPGFVLLYEIGDKPLASSPDVNDIASFRVKTLWDTTPGGAYQKYADWVRITPQQWADDLVDVRRQVAAQLDRERSRSDKLRPVTRLAAWITTNYAISEVNELIRILAFGVPLSDEAA